MVSPQGRLAAARVALWQARPEVFPRGEQAPERQVFPRPERRPVSRRGAPRALPASLRVREAFPQREQAQQVPERQTLPLLVQGLAFRRGSPLEPSDATDPSKK